MGQGSSGDSTSANQLKNNDPEDEILDVGNETAELDARPPVSLYGSTDGSHMLDRTSSHQTKIVDNRKRKISSKEHVAQNPNTIQKRFQSRQLGIEKPAFRVSAFVSPSSDHNSASFNTSLNSSSFDFTGGKRSTFYSGHTTFGGSATIREKNAKRMKIEPVSNNVRTTRTQIKAKPLRMGKKNTITSETAKKILNTLDRMSAPVKDARKMSSFRHPMASSQTTGLLRTPVSKFVPPSSTNATNSKQFSSNSSVAKSQPTISQKVPNLTFTPQLTSFQKTPNSFSSNASKLKSEHAFGNMESVTKKIKESVSNISRITAALPVTVSSSSAFTFASSKSFTVSINNSRNNEAISQVSTTHQVKDHVTSLRNTLNNKEFPDVLTVLPKTNKTKKNVESSFEFSSPGVLGKKTNQTHSTPFKAFAFSIPHKITSEKDVKDTDNRLLEQTGNKTLRTLNFIQEKPAGSWDCPTCMIVNKSSDSKCVACTEPKPITSENASLPAKETKVFKTLNFVQEKPAGSWDCPTCMIVNKFSDSKCVACTEPKPITSKNTSIPAKETKVFKTLNFVQEKPAGSWDCPTCMIVNKFSDSKCVACTEPKPITSKNTSIPAKESKVFKTLNFVQEKPAGSWDCPTCMIVNKSSDKKCVACTEPKPGSNKITDSSVDALKLSNSFTTTASSGFSFNAKSISGVTFGAPTSISSSGFTFGQPATSSSSSVTFGAPTSTSSSGFTFGQPATSSSSAVTFGAPTSTSSSGFTFGEPTTSSISAVTFGAPTSTSSSGFTFGEPTTFSSSAVTFGAPTSTSSSGFKFGEPTTSSSSAVTFGSPTSTSGSGFTFGQPATSSSSGVTFGAPTSTSSSGFTFGEPTTSSSSGVKLSTSAAGSGFAFTKPATTSSSGLTFGVSTSTTNSGFSFGMPATLSNSSTSSTSSSDFTSGKPSLTPSSGFAFVAPATLSSSSAPSLFTTSSDLIFHKAVAASSSGFAFEAPASETSSGFSFGMPTASSTSSTSSTSSSSTPNSGFSFGQPALTSSSGFAFGATSSHTSSSTFLFGDRATANDASSIGASEAKFQSSVNNKDVTTKTGFNLSMNNSKSLDTGNTGKYEFGFNSGQTNMAGFSFGFKPASTTMNDGSTTVTNSGSLFSFGTTNDSMNSSEKPKAQFSFTPQFSTGSLFNMGSSDQSKQFNFNTSAGANPSFNVKGATATGKTSSLGKTRHDKRIRRRLQRP